MNRQIFLFCMSSVLVIQSIDYESSNETTSVENFEDNDDDNLEDIVEEEFNDDLNSESEEREGKLFFNRRPLRFRRPLLSPRVASLFATIPTLFGKGRLRGNYQLNNILKVRTFLVSS